VKREGYEDAQEIEIAGIGKRKRAAQNDEDQGGAPASQRSRLAAESENLERKSTVKFEVDDRTALTADRDVLFVKESPSQAPSPQEELRTLIKLDITVGNMNLIDQFEWDLADNTSSPEQFAEVFTADLGLNGEFKTAVAHQIREQVAVFLKSLAIIGHPFNGLPVADEELRAAILPPLEGCERTENQVDSYTPKLLQLTEAEIDKLTKEREREARRKRRQTKGRRGAQLPDREPNKTQRSPVVYGLMANNAVAASREAAVPATSFGAFAGLSTRRAAAIAASQSFAAGLGVDSAGPSVAAEMSVKLNQKRVKSVNPEQVHQHYPGGLGRRQDAEGPLFTPSAPPRSPTLSKPPVEAAEKRPGPKPKVQPIRPPEFAHLRPNLIDGMWHCSNCGVPGSLGPGRRKGPLGDKSLCSVCGKFYHRYRKVPEVEYNLDEHHHIQQQRARAAAEAEAKQDGSMDGVEKGADVGEGDNGDRLTASKLSKNSLDGLEFQEIGSPDDSDSEESEIDSRQNSPAKRTLLRTAAVDNAGLTTPSRSVASPLSRAAAAGGDTAALNGAASSAAGPGSAAMEASPSVASTTANGTAPGSVTTPNASAGRALSPGARARLPAWITAAVDSKKAKYPQDKFEIQVRNRPAGAPPAPEPEWRVRCSDCPGRLYTLGPGRTLDNFEIHLKNRGHRANVRTRLGGTSTGP